MGLASTKIATLFGPTIGECGLVAIARDPGAEDVPGWTNVDRRALNGAPKADPTLVREFKAAIVKGDDPLGETFCTLRPREIRREIGATFTPDVIVKSMLDWFEVVPPPNLCVYPGCGSARFLLNAGRRS